MSTRHASCLIEIFDVPNPGLPPELHFVSARDLDRRAVAGNLDFEDTKNVPLTPDLIPPASANLVRERLPTVWKQLGAK